MEKSHFFSMFLIVGEYRYEPERFTRNDSEKGIDSVMPGLNKSPCLALS